MFFNQHKQNKTKKHVYCNNQKPSQLQYHNNNEYHPHRTLSAIAIRTNQMKIYIKQKTKTKNSRSPTSPSWHDDEPSTIGKGKIRTHSFILYTDT